jgi:hypothetical protein
MFGFPDLYPGFPQKLQGHTVGVSFGNNDLGYAGVDQHFRANKARLMRGIKRGAFNAYPMECRLYQDILFRVQTAAKFMALAGRDT